MLQVQSYLDRNSLEDLKQKLGINYKRHHKYPNLVLLKYNQIESPKNHPIVRECRGIILDEDQAWKVVSMGYRRFLNFGEDGADPIDIESSKVYEKLDGTLICLYNYNNEWLVSTSGMPDAFGRVGKNDFSFEELFWKTWRELNYDLDIDPNYTYMFELMTKYNQLVVQHQKSRIVLHGARHVLDLQEIDPDMVPTSWEKVRWISFNGNWDKLIQIADSLEPRDAEGFVVCDKNFNRVKLKSRKHVMYFHMRQSVNTEKILQIILANEGDEFLTYCSEWKNEFEELIKKVKKLQLLIESVWECYKNINNKKEFASKAKNYAFSSILFSLYDLKITSVWEGFLNMTSKKFKELVEKEEI
jgi:hypothetical protein